MTTYDLTPFHRATVGFDSLFDELENRFFTNTVNGTSYPPYNIIKTDETNYAIELALAGFDRKDVEIEIDQAAVVSHQARPRHGDALGLVGPVAL